MFPHQSPLKKVYLCTFGCQMNEHDSERITGLLDSAGYQFVDKEALADIILFNTCSIRDSAEQRVYGRVTQLGPLKKQNPHLLIGICGCMAEKQKEELFRKLPMVDFVIGPRQWVRIKETLDALLQSRHQKIITGVGVENIQPLQQPKRDNRIKAWVSIMEGCDNFCAYCVVPYVRGREVSRPLPEIIAEVEQLAKEGYKEITILGQNVNSYQHNGIGFAELLRRLNQIEGIARIRYMTSHPRDFNLEIIQAIQESPKVCDHFHLPIQSGSDYILERMNRGYTFAHYQNIVNEIRKRFPTASITTDIIVGFPGESEAEYQKTVAAMKTIQWDSAFLFMFSSRSGTAAAMMDNPIPLSIRKQRIHQVVELQKQISEQKQKQLIGKHVEVLIEGTSKHKLNQWFGRTRQNTVAVFPANGKIQPGDMVSVTVTNASAYTLFGKLVPPDKSGF
ncbi:MAG: tRNA (N6-isopentenyl adenosine(37)-C2)-methylthiotransferase MiaB [bacterium]|nr:tRNA (N6-isopentenyl adenosine(37)-C2)-methylthiotransferase MiaB [bacterium]